MANLVFSNLEKSTTGYNWIYVLVLYFDGVPSDGEVRAACGGVDSFDVCVDLTSCCFGWVVGDTAASVAGGLCRVEVDPACLCGDRES